MRRTSADGSSASSPRPATVLPRVRAVRRHRHAPHAPLSTGEVVCWHCAEEAGEFECLPSSSAASSTQHSEGSVDPEGRSSKRSAFRKDTLRPAPTSTPRQHLKQHESLCPSLHVDCPGTLARKHQPPPSHAHDSPRVCNNSLYYFKPPLPRTAASPPPRRAGIRKVRSVPEVEIKWEDGHGRPQGLHLP